MNLETRPRHSEAEKRAFYGSAAKRFKAELRLYGATAAIHLENKNDEVFWSKVLKEAYPQGKFRFISSSRSIGGNVTCGCTQCLQYREFLDKHFWIAIDSDYRYLSEEQDIDARHYILQTYTYSFENHFCYWKNCQRASGMPQNPTEENGEAFDWQSFLVSYSRAVYPLLVWQLYLQSVDPEAFPKSVFHRLLSLPIGPKSIEKNGASVIHILKDRCRKFVKHLQHTYPDADETWFEARCNAMGVHRDNCYLFVRGHQLYDMIVDQGKKMDRQFERELLKQIYFGEYDEIQKIHEDIVTLTSGPKPSHYFTSKPKYPTASNSDTAAAEASADTSNSNTSAAEVSTDTAPKTEAATQPEDVAQTNTASTTAPESAAPEADHTI